MSAEASQRNQRRHPGGVLTDVAQALGLAQGVWADNESPTDLRLPQVDLELAAVREAGFAVFELLIDYFGAHATGELRASDLDYQKLAALNAQTFAELLEVASDTGGLQCSLRIDKSAWLRETLGVEDSDTACLWLLDVDFLCRLFSKPLGALEDVLWDGGDAAHAVVLAPGRDIDLRSPYLKIATWDTLLSADTEAAVGRRDTPLHDLYARARRLVKWEHTWVETLTPTHLRTTGECADARLRQVLATQFARLFLLYTGDHTSGPATQPQSATFSGAHNHLGLPFPTADFDLRQLHAIDTLDAILRWVYAEEQFDADRITFIQTQLVSTLVHVEAPERPGELLDRADELYRKIRQSWKIYVEDKIRAYENKLQGVLDKAEETANAYYTRVDEVVARLGRSALTTTATLAAVAAGVLFEKDINPDVIFLGLSIYAGYVLLFPCTLGMVHASRRVTLARKQYDARRARLHATLPEDLIDDAEGDTVEDAAREFARWKWVASAIYVASALLLIYLGASIDSFLTGA